MNIINARGILINGECVTVKILADDICRVEDECYTPADIQAFELGEWQYVGVVVETAANEDASLWGVHYGAIAGHKIYLDQIVTDAYMNVDGVDFTLPESLMSEIKEGRKVANGQQV